MYVYVYKYTYSSPLPLRLRLTYTHIYTHARTCRSGETARGDILDLTGRTGKSSREKSEAVTHVKSLSSEFPRDGLPLVYHDVARGILFSAYYTPAATGAYRLLHIHAHTYPAHSTCRRTYTHTHTHLSRCDGSEKRTCINARSRARV